jgi:hypothetical protein
MKIGLSGSFELKDAPVDCLWKKTKVYKDDLVFGVVYKKIGGSLSWLNSKKQ